MAFVEASAPSMRQRRQSAINSVVSELTDTSMVGNILGVYDKATADEYSTGLGWYHVAHEIAVGLGIGPEAGAGVIAALSPQLNWTFNIAAAQNLVANDNPYPAGIGTFVRRARAIRDGEDPFIVLGGRKVRSFYRNVLLPSHYGTVTIDRHAVAIATPESNIRILERGGAYIMIASAYRTAARMAGLIPSELQAIVWCTWRNQLNEKGERGSQFRN